MKFIGANLQQLSIDDLTERISIVYYDMTLNSRGKLIKDAEIIRCMVWAKILPITGKVDDVTPEKRNTITYRITIRYRTDIKPDDVVYWRRRYLKIITPPVDIELRHMWTQFDCVEVIKDGKVSTSQAYGAGI